MAPGRTPRSTVAPLLAVAPSVAILLLDDRLPDPLATHFALSGAADGFSGRTTALAANLALGVGLAAVFEVTERAGGADPLRTFVGLTWGASGLLGVVLTATLGVNIGVADARTAVLPLWVLPAGLAVGAATGWLAARFTPARPPADGTDGTDGVPDPVRLGPTERASWSRRTSSRSLIGFGAGLIAAGIALGASLGATAGIVPGAAGVLVVAISSARTTVDRRGLTVTFGPAGLARLHVPTADIASATVTDVVPIQFGGWGYRLVPGGRGVIVRSGPGLVVTRRDGRHLTVTVDDPETAAALLNGLVART